MKKETPTMDTIEKDENGIPIISWRGKYDRSWKGILVPEAFVHPAKVAPALAEAIYEFAFEQGWLKVGDKVLDPFGGIAGFAYPALKKGLYWIGVELEEKFVRLGNMNIESWNEKWAHLFPRWGKAILVQGDSRKLIQVLTEKGLLTKVELAVDSPPYANSLDSDRSGIDWSKSKKDYPGRVMHDERIAMQTRNHDKLNYGDDPANLGGMREGSVDAAITSSPYADSPINPGNVDNRMVEEKWGKGVRLAAHDDGYSAAPENLGNLPEGNADAVITSSPFTQPTTRDRTAFQDGNISDFMGRAYTVDRQGTTEGNLAAMEMEGFDALVDSPAYIGMSAGAGGLNTKPGTDGQQSGRNPNSASQAADQNYGQSEGQLSRMAEGDVDAIVSSSPYEASMSSGKNGIDQTKFKSPRGAQGVHNQVKDPQQYGLTDGQLGNMQGGFEIVAGSSPYSAARVGDVSGAEQVGHNKNYGAETGQLGGMSDEGFETTIASSPYPDSSANDERPLGGLAERRGQGGSTHRHYGNTDGQLGGMAAENSEAVTTSSPYLPKDDRKVAWGHDHEGLQDEDVARGYKPISTFRGSYSNDPANLGNPTGADQETFWSAAQQIVAQTYLLLKPNGHAFWVCKDFVRDRQIVPFCDQWRRLCESVGFKTVCVIRAWQTTEHGVQLATEHGKPKRKAKQKKSFFRRNAEMNAQAIEHWKAETHKAMYVDQARKLVEDDYKTKQARWKKKHKAEEKPPVKPTTKRIQHVAQKLAYEQYLEQGNARAQSGVEIDYEQVIVMVK